MAHCGVQSFASPEDHRLGLPELNKRYLQTGPGRYAGHLQQVRPDADLLVYRERLDVPILREGWTRKGLRMFAIALPVESRATFHGRAVGAAVAHLAGGREYSVQSPGPSEHLGIVLADSTFSIHADYLGGVPRLAWTGEPLLEAPAAARERLASRILCCLLGATKNVSALVCPAARMTLRDDVLEHLFCLLIDAELPGRRRDITRLTYSDIVHRSREHLRANADRPVGVLELSGLLRVSRRTIQTAFMEVTGVTPQTYLRAIRLSSVRRLLRQTSADRLTVSQAAARWGFVHMSRFAAEYGRMFGCLPSEAPRA
ncbi:Transcriptional regulator, AraC-family [Cupriavidus necator]|uniref:Transcriptional regulator, AraC-family n=1 Tax=Cupriavidus necator (strain ATCC 17699 / DSM 428 / KCTC 22496 / NCIMB 10442 / H16 / Stanier 337) TaxID=381666 RepID=Q0K462_CUPNH|nr:transcriptional regulator, AraC-family [Cupriavidus necator H16]